MADCKRALSTNPLNTATTANDGKGFYSYYINV